MSDSNKVPCPHCGGSALSPYPDDGGSCPHCFNGEVEAVEQPLAADVAVGCPYCGSESLVDHRWHCPANP